ncbi:MAG TPA: glycosyltransferase [Chloroflexota bacterium]|nr:glycosyltransferase [Chloroflexota bacterium]
MSRIRVLRLIARMNVGGPALQVTALADGLDPQRFESLLLTGFVAEGEEDYLHLRAPHVAVQRVKGLGRSVRVTGDASAFAGIIRHIRQFRPDIVHTHTAKAGVLGRLAAKMCGVPYLVHTFHGHLLHGYFSPRVTEAVRRTEAVLARSTDRLLAVGNQVRDDLLDAGIGTPEKFAVVPPGVALPAPMSPSAARRVLDLPSGGPVVAYVARLTTIKRPERVIDVAKQIVTQRPDVTFAIAGEGPLLSPLQAMARPLGERVRFLGWLPDVQTLYGAADAVLLTSDNEGMPVSLIEAAMCGLPAVATDVGSTREVVLHGSTGYVVEPNVQQIAEGLLALLNDDDARHRMGVAAAVRARDRFSSQRLVNDTAGIYEALLSGK